MVDFNVKSRAIGEMATEGYREVSREEFAAFLVFSADDAETREFVGDGVAVFQVRDSKTEKMLCQAVYFHGSRETVYLIREDV